MRYPYSLFLRFLISRKADVGQTLKSLGLPQISPEEKREHGPPSSPMPRCVEEFFRSPKNTISKKEGFLEWAKANNIYELWAIQPEFKDKVNSELAQQMMDACALFADPVKRSSLAVLVVKKFDPEDISNIFSEKFDTPIDAKTLSLAKKYFFDFSKLSQADWKNLLTEMPKEQKSILHLAVEPHSKEFIQYSVGRVPALTFDDIMHDIMVSSYYKFKACLNQPLADARAMDWANLAMKAGVNKVRFGSGDKASFSDEIQLRFEFSEPNFPTLESLASGE